MQELSNDTLAIVAFGHLVEDEWSDGPEGVANAIAADLRKRADLLVLEPVAILAEDIQPGDRFHNDWIATNRATDVRSYPGHVHVYVQYRDGGYGWREWIKGTTIFLFRLPLSFKG